MVAPPTLGSGGQPLDAATRGYFEARLGHDFSRVRVHHDEQAARATRSVHARAFTVRSDIAFAPGEYSPGTNEGRRLLAHELVHTIQQRGTDGAPTATLKVSEPGDAMEQEADRVASEVIGSSPPHVGATLAHRVPGIHLQSRPSVALVQRKPSGAAQHQCGKDFLDPAHAFVKAEPAGKAERRIYPTLPQKADPKRPEPSKPEPPRQPILEVGAPLIVGQLEQGVWRAVCYEPTFRKSGWEMGWIPNYYVEYAKSGEPKAEAAAESAEERAERRKDEARKRFRHGIEKLVEHERKVAAGGQPREAEAPKGSDSMKAFSNAIRTFQVTVGMMPFDSIVQLLTWVDEVIAWAKQDSESLVRRFRLYREAIVEEYDAQQLAMLVQDAKEAEAEYQAAMAALRNQQWIDQMGALPPALDPKQSPYAALAVMASPVTVPLWTALVIASDVVADFIPIVGQVKGGIEAFTGRSMSGQFLLQLEDPTADPDKLPQDLEPWERAVAALPLAIDSAVRVVRAGKATGRLLFRTAKIAGVSIKDAAKMTLKLASLQREFGSAAKAVARLQQAIDLRWVVRSLDLGADIIKDLPKGKLAGLRKLFERLGSAARAQFRSLSDTIKAALLGCRSTCKVDLAALEKQLAAAAKAKGSFESFMKDFPKILKGLKDQAAIKKSIEVLLGTGAVGPDDLAKIISKARGKGVARVLGYMEKARNAKNAQRVFTDLGIGGNKFKGAEFVLRWIDEGGKWGDLKAFEIAGDKRFWDALIGTKLHQFKSWKAFRPGTFVEQFTKDLAQKAPQEIVWVFEKTVGITGVKAVRGMMKEAIEASTLGAAEKAELLKGLKDIAVVVAP